MKKFVGPSLSISVLLLSICPGFSNTPSNNTSKHIILFVWDGLRPDSITAEHTPNLFALKQKGVWFSDNHSTYPTFTMMNAASFATGDLAGKTGFYGNTLWDPKAKGVDATGKPVDFQAPVFTEDYHILQDMNQPEIHEPLFFVPTLFSLAQKAGLSTATFGKSGPAFMQDYRQTGGMNGINMDEKHVYPLEFAKQLQADNYPIPALSPNAYPKNALRLNDDNGDPTGFGPITKLKALSANALGINADFIYPDNVTSDPSATNASPYSKANRYLMQTYLSKVFLKQQPNLSVIWLRNPDTTEHNYGVGSPSYYTALHDQDALLGELIDALKKTNRFKTTDIFIASDHSHSNVSGPLDQFPLRNIKNGSPGTIDGTGYSVSGNIRPADLLQRAGFHAYDGQGCQYDPVLSGIQRDGRLVYPILTDHHDSHCDLHYTTTKSYRVPSELGDEDIVVAGNGGSTYFYLPKHKPELAKRIVRFLQSREEFGVVFLDDRYGQVPGTFPMSLVRILNPQGRNPDIIVGHHYDDNAKIRGMTGIEFNSGGNSRGMHGSFSRTDVHNTLIALGPDFKSQWTDNLPTGNIDVAPTIAHLLGINLPDTHGRVLYEAFKNGRDINDYQVISVHLAPKEPATDLNYQLATNPDGKDKDSSKTHFTVDLQAKWLILDQKTYPYFDQAKEQRY